MNQTNRPLTIALFGPTGVGKSNLGNKILGREHFKVGHGLFPETDSVASEVFIWPLDPTLTVKIIDTLSFTDQRLEKKNALLLPKILDFLKSMRDGLTIAVYCLPAKAHISQHHTQELKMLGWLLGNTFFDHVCFAITQGETFMEGQRLKISENLKTHLSEIFLENGRPPVTEDRILFADFENFQEAFMKPLTQEMQTTNSYVPELSRDINTEDPESIRRLLATPEMRELMNYYENRLAAQLRGNEKRQQRIAQNAQEVQQKVRTHNQEQANLQRTIEMIHQELSGPRIQSENERRRLEELERETERRLQDVRRDVENLNNQNNDLQRALNDGDSTLKTLNTIIVKLQNARNQQARVVYDVDEGWNLF